MMFHAAEITKYGQVAILHVVDFLHSLSMQFNLHSLL